MASPWNVYRARTVLFFLSPLVALLWLVPGSRIRSALVRDGWHEDLSTFLAITLPAFCILATAHLRRMFWPCPRCGRHFHVSWWYGNPFASRCVHCGLPLWEEAGRERPDPA